MEIRLKQTPNVAVAMTPGPRLGGGPLSTLQLRVPCCWPLGGSTPSLVLNRLDSHGASHPTLSTIPRTRRAGNTTTTCRGKTLEFGKKTCSSGHLCRRGHLSPLSQLRLSFRCSSKGPRPRLLPLLVCRSLASLGRGCR